MAKVCLEIVQEDGSIRKYKKERIQARWFKELLKLEAKITELEKEGNAIEIMDLRVGFVADFFGDPNLTEDAIYEGVDSDKIISEFNKITGAIIGKTEENENAGKS